MKVKNLHILIATRFLSGINVEKRSIKFAFHVYTVINRVNTAFKAIEDFRQKIVSETQLKDENKNPVYLDDKKQFAKLSDEGNTKLAELMELESDIEFEQFTLDELESVGITIEPANIEPIKWLIKA